MSHPDVALRNNLQLKRGGPRVERWMLQQIFKAIGPAPLRFAIQNGMEISTPGVSPTATVVIRDRRTLARLIMDPEVAFGEAYSDGRIHVEGDLAGALEAAYEAWPSGRAGRGRYQRLMSTWMNWVQDNTLSGSLSNIHTHYD